MREVKKLSWDEFLKEFDEEVHPQLESMKNKDIKGIAMMVCAVLDSSRCGQKTAMCYGDGCTFKSIDHIQEPKGGVYINGLPSTASFVEAYWEKEI